MGPWRADFCTASAGEQETVSKSQTLQSRAVGEATTFQHENCTGCDQSKRYGLPGKLTDPQRTDSPDSPKEKSHFHSRHRGRISNHRSGHARVAFTRPANSCGRQDGSEGARKSGDASISGRTRY